MKKVCNNCRALSVDSCLLGYTIQVTFHRGRKVLSPMQDCPKPMSFNRYNAIKYGNVYQDQLTLEFVKL